MQQLETTKGKSVVIPRLVKRYTILCYREGSGWQTGYALHTTPESALEQFLGFSLFILAIINYLFFFSIIY